MSLRFVIGVRYYFGNQCKTLLRLFNLLRYRYLLKKEKIAELFLVFILILFFNIYEKHSRTFVVNTAKKDEATLCKK